MQSDVVTNSLTTWRSTLGMRRMNSAGNAVLLPSSFTGLDTCGDGIWSVATAIPGQGGGGGSSEAKHDHVSSSEKRTSIPFAIPISSDRCSAPGGGCVCVWVWAWVGVGGLTLDVCDSSNASSPPPTGVPSCFPSRCCARSTTAKKKHPEARRAGEGTG